MVSRALESLVVQHKNQHATDIEIMIYLPLIVLIIQAFIIDSKTGDTLTNEFGMKFKFIPAGSFQMGGVLDNEQPIHRVHISKPFYFGIYEVTQNEYISVMNKKPAYCSEPDLPVGVTWNEANAFCERLSKLTGEKYRLPTEAEWEYSARAGKDQLEYVWGNSPIPEINGQKFANIPDESFHKIYSEYKYLKGYSDGFAGLAPVGSFKPNDFGLYDMAGNAWERCQDWYDENYYMTSPVMDPQGPNSGTRRSLRGGGYKFGLAERMRVAYRCGSPIDRAGANDGFRVVLEIQK